VSKNKTIVAPTARRRNRENTARTAGFPQFAPHAPRGAAGRRLVGSGRPKEACPLTLIWFVVWLVFNVIGDSESLTFDPVNWWAGLLLLAIALDLARQHAPELGKTSGGA
jgi:hypothetical protein